MSSEGLFIKYVVGIFSFLAPLPCHGMSQYADPSRTCGAWCTTGTVRRHFVRLLLPNIFFALKSFDPNIFLSKIILTKGYIVLIILLPITFTQLTRDILVQSFDRINDLSSSSPSRCLLFGFVMYFRNFSYFDVVRTAPPVFFDLPRSFVLRVSQHFSPQLVLVTLVSI